MAGHRLFVLTDIKRGLENDDIQSLVRLLLYANVIDIEGLVATSSCWHKKGGRAKDAAVIHSVIDAYAAARPNLETHEPGFPTAEQLRAVVACGVPTYGAAPGDGFADARWSDVGGVRALIEAATRDDPRPLWVALWGGANTLAQALWAAEREVDRATFAHLLSRLRIHAISDQDPASHWLRERYGDRLFSIVSPSPVGGSLYRHATWPGLSADRFSHGSEDGQRGGGFRGADHGLVSRRWARRVVRRTGAYGRAYPVHRFIMEGDTPSYLALIPNGLNDPEHPDAGGWGGRYAHYVPDADYTGTRERHPIWTNASDTVLGDDGVLHTSPQATIWRWREDIQNDFVGRLRWAATPDRSAAIHPPIVELAHADDITLTAGAAFVLDATPSRDPDGRDIEFEWIHYAEAGSTGEKTVIVLDDARSARCTVSAPEVDRPIRVTMIVSVRAAALEPITRYRRVTIHVMPR